MKKLKPGDPAPSFTLPDQRGDPVSLSGFLGRKLLVYFYPKADTPGCTLQACAVRDGLPPLRAAGVAAVGISPDEPSAQGRFDGKHGLGFPLLSDGDRAVARAYGAWAEKPPGGGSGGGMLRSAFLIDEAGRIAGAWYRVRPEDTVPNVQAALAARG